MNRIFNNLEQFVSTLHLQVEMDYDEEEHIIYILNDNWKNLILIRRKEINEIEMSIGIKSEFYQTDNETDIKDIVLWMYYHILQYDHKMKIHQFMNLIQKKYSSQKMTMDFENQTIEIENLLLKIDESGNIISDEEEEGEIISNISYDIHETIDWINLHIFYEVALS